jgi:hypothetical protein
MAMMITSIQIKNKFLLKLYIIYAFCQKLLIRRKIITVMGHNKVFQLNFDRKAIKLGFNLINIVSVLL